MQIPRRSDRLPWPQHTAGQPVVAMSQWPYRNHHCGGTFAPGRPFQGLEITMTRVAAAILAGLLSVSAAAAQSTAASGDKPETACTTSPAATTGKGEEKTANSMAAEKSAVLPDAGGANSAAPTVQSGGSP